MNTPEKPLLADFDFSELESPDFKEDPVREELVKPILNALGYRSSGMNKIIRSKGLKHPFVKIGAGRREITVVPDYLLQVNGRYAWVLDAKAPNEEVKTGGNVEQAYFYAIHPDIHVKLYALCNGKEFAAFLIDRPEPVVYFHLTELERHFATLKSWVSPGAFETGELVPLAIPAQEEHFDYSAAVPPSAIIARKQSAKRHFGVHGYFTRQAYDVVQEYIENFTKPGDLVLDPFGGYGVTLLESLMLGRRAIHIDLNPLSVFIINSLIAACFSRRGLGVIR